MWEAGWAMEFNPSKGQVVQVTGSRKPINCTYRLHSQVPETVISAKYLGFDVSSGLIWNSHIDRITGNANKTLGFLKLNYWFSFTLVYSRISHEYSSLFIIVINLIFMFSL